MGPVLGRLRSAGFNVIDVARPGTSNDHQLTTVVWLMVCAADDVYLSSITVDFQISTFELLCTRVTVGQFVYLSSL
jgi:hypothetical protein